MPRYKWGDNHLGYVVEWEEVTRDNQSVTNQNSDSKNSVSLGMGSPPAFVITIKNVTAHRHYNASESDCRIFRVTVSAFNSHGRGPPAGPKHIALAFRGIS